MKSRASFLVGHVLRRSLLQLLRVDLGGGDVTHATGCNSVQRVCTRWFIVTPMKGKRNGQGKGGGALY